VTKAVLLLTYTRIRDVFFSKLGQDTNYLEGLHGFSPILWWFIIQISI